MVISKIEFITCFVNGYYVTRIIKNGVKMIEKKSKYKNKSISRAVLDFSILMDCDYSQLPFFKWCFNYDN